MPVDASALEALAASLAAGGAKIYEASVKVVETNAKQARDNAKRLAPQGATGDLQDSIEWDFGGGGNGGSASAVVFSRLRYAGFNEFGTSRQPPNPFIRPAVENQEAQLAHDLEQAGVDVIEKA